MGDEEIEFDDDAPQKVAEPKPAAVTPGAKAVLEYFGNGVEGPFPGPEDVEKLSESPLAYTSICEPMLKELFLLTSKRKEIIKGEKDLKEELEGFLGLERGMIQRGAFGAKVSDVKGKSKTNWKDAVAAIKAWAKEQIGKEAPGEIQRIIKEHTLTGEDGISITPYMVGSTPEEDKEES